MKILMLTTALHPVPVDPDHEVARTQEHAERAVRGEPFDKLALDPFNFEKGGFSLRFEEDKVYEVDEDTAQYLINQSWAIAAPKDTKAKDLAQPLDTREVDDSFADKLEREVHAPARERAKVETVRFVGTGEREVVGTGEQDVHEGENVRVVDLRQAVAPVTEGTTLDVQDARTETTTDL